jgi:chitinase
MYSGVSMGALSHIVDQVGIMNYDYTGPWNHTTGFLAPLYSDNGRSVEKSILAYRDAGVPAGKLLMGLPFYGYGWQQVSSTGHGLFQPGQAIHGDRPYSFLATLARAAPSEETAPEEKNPSDPPAPFTIYRDPRSHAPWLYDGNTFWTFDDPTSIRFKVGFALEQHLGGIMAWELSEDTADAALVRAARSSLDQTLAAHDPDRPSPAHPSAEADLR